MNLIVAVSKDYAIGKDNRLLFNLPTDLAYFKEKTINKVVVMGEKTYLSLPKRPLPKRINIVLSDNLSFTAEGAIVVHSLVELFQQLNHYDSKDIFVCGGASIYNLLMDYCDTAFITMIEKSVPADAYIDNIEKRGFVLESSSALQKENGIIFSFKTFKNLNPKTF